LVKFDGSVAENLVVTNDSFLVESVGRSRGLPSLQVHTVTQDNLGRVWFGGPAGVSRHDGNSVRVFTQRDGLLTHGVRALVPSADGGIWVGSDRGIDLIDSSCKVADRTTFEATAGLVECFAQDSRGGLFAGTNYGVYELSSNNHWSRLDKKNFDESIAALVVSNAGHLWAACASGLRRWDGHFWSDPTRDGWKIAGRIRSLQKWGSDGILLGSDNGVFAMSADGDVDPSFTLHTESTVKSMLVDGVDLWIGSGRGLRHLRNAFEGSPETSLVSEVVANDLFADRQGNIWIGTESNGVLKTSLMRHALLRPERCGSGAVLSITPLPDVDAQIIGTDVGAQISRSDGSSSNELEAFRGERVWDVLPYGEGKLLAACNSGLVSTSITQDDEIGDHKTNREIRSINNPLVRIEPLHAVLGAPCRSLLQDGPDILVGSIRGLCRYSESEGEHTVVEVKRPDGGSLGYVYSLIRMSTEEVWVATLGDGLWRLHNGQTLSPITATGLVALGNTYSVAVGTTNIAVLQDNRIVVLDKAGSLVTKVIEASEAVAGWTCLFDAAGALWVGSSNGLRKYDVGAGELTRQITSWLGADAWEFTTSRSLQIDSNSHLWCGVAGGLVVVDPERLPRHDDLPTPELGDLTWNLSDAEQPKRRGNNFVLTEGKWSFEASMFAPWYIDEADVQFRFRLLGFDRDWSPLQRGRARYNSVPAGTYTLQAQAFSPLVGWGPAAELFTLEVHQSARTESLLTGLKYLTGVRRRANRKNSKQHELEQAVRERTVELTRTSELLAKANRDLDALSNTDPLTGVGNRRSLDQRLDFEMRRSTRTNEPLSLLFIDVDHFKRFNDRHGHHIGDQCLKAIGATLTKAMQRPNDLAARFGGEEFVVLLPTTTLRGAIDVAERIRQSVLEEVAVQGDGPLGAEPISVSVGVATRVFSRTADFAFDSNANAVEFLRSADSALYAAKNGGRNRVVSAPAETGIDSPEPVTQKHP
jgi:diguanylate cyclase (GGDEF)-like protein